MSDLLFQIRTQIPELAALSAAAATMIAAWRVSSALLRVGGTGKASVGMKRLYQQSGRDKVIEEDALSPKSEKQSAVSSIGVALAEAIAKVPLIGQIIMTQDALDATESRLVWAGRPYGLDASGWIAIKNALIVGALLIGFMAYTFGGMSFAAYAALIVASVFLPERWLTSQIKARHAQMERELVWFIDKLMLATMSQSQILSALGIVAKHTQGIISDEVKNALTRLRTGSGELSVKDVFRDMDKRCGNQYVTSFCTAIINASDVRASVAEILQEQVEIMKEAKRARNEEVINKSETMLTASAALGFMAVLLLAIAPGFILALQGVGQLK